MPKKKKSSRGVKGHRHSPKAKREARHVASSERKRGVSKSRAKKIGWATVHKEMPHGQREKKKER